jgi:hypothetical protein
MLRVLTPEEELASRRERFRALRRGTLFDLGGRRHFIAVHKRGQTVDVIELDAANIGRLLRGRPCESSTLHFDGLVCLNVTRAGTAVRSRGKRPA